MPVPTQFQNNEYGYKDTEEVTDCGNDTDNTDNTLLYKFITACNICWNIVKVITRQIFKCTGRDIKNKLDVRDTVILCWTIDSKYLIVIWL